jgi:hypothetical protein
MTYIDFLIFIHSSSIFISEATQQLMRGWAWNFQDLRAGVVQTEKERYDVGTLESIREFYVRARGDSSSVP